MNVDHLTRQLSLIPMDVLGEKVNIIGCGAIGSFLALSLAKMGITRLEVHDFDEVSVENMSNQFFRFSDIGKPKALALAELIKDFTGVTIKTGLEPVRTCAGMTGIVVVAVDSMAVRKELFESIVRDPNGVKFLIDPRMGAESYQQTAVDPREADERVTYRKTLYSDDEAVQAPCTAKSTVYTATLASGVIVKTVKNWLLREPYPKNIKWNIKASQDSMDMYASNRRQIGG